MLSTGGREPNEGAAGCVELGSLVGYAVCDIQFALRDQKEQRDA
jgi:hypothetical protein